MSEENKAIETKIKELENVNRLLNNTLNLINDVEIKGAYAGPVAEIQGWLTGFKASIHTQLEGFKAALPKPSVEPVKEEVKV